MISKPVAITVSTNFSDILPYSIKHNLDYFDHWYIVTSKEDIATQQIVNDMASDRITLLYWEFASLYEDHEGNLTKQRYFDKGGAIKYAQQRAYDQFHHHWYLVMDTDILIRSQRDLITEYLCPEYIYGPQARLDFASIKDYDRGIVHRSYFQGSPRIIGFFQLYKQKYYYRPSIDSNLCDDEFTRLWAHDHRRFLSMTVDHLGHWAPGIPNSHRGRQLGVGFTGNV